MEYQHKLLIVTGILAAIAIYIALTLPAEAPGPDSSEAEALLLRSAGFGKGLGDYSYSYGEVSEGYRTSYALVANGNEKMAEVGNPLSTKNIYMLENDTIFCISYPTGEDDICSSVKGDAEMEMLASALAGGRSSRLYRRLVYEEQVAQDVSAFQDGGEIGGSFYIIATAKPEVDLDVLEAAIREEVESAAGNGVREEELERARNGVETAFVGMLERVGGFGGKADLLNRYHFQAGTPGFVRGDLARYKDATLEGLGEVARTHLVGRGGVVLSVVPHGREDLAAEEDKG